MMRSGENIQLTFSNRVEYVERALQYRMHEMDRQVQAVREGMAWIIPVPILSLLTGEKLERLVCGSAEVNVDVLKKVVRYVLELNTFFFIGFCSLFRFILWPSTKFL